MSPGMNPFPGRSSPPVAVLFQAVSKVLSEVGNHTGELDAAVTDLNAVKSELTAENEAKAKTVAEQDKALNTAWFVFGTKKEPVSYTHLDVYKRQLLIY